MKAPRVKENGVSLRGLPSVQRQITCGYSAGPEGVPCHTPRPKLEKTSPQDDHLVFQRPGSSNDVIRSVTMMTEGGDVGVFDGASGVLVVGDLSAWDQ